MAKDLSDRDRLWTVPNAISTLRFFGLAPLLWAAHQGNRDLFLWLVAALLFTDWLDGKLAVALDQRTTIGARLDSMADALLYACISVSFLWLEEDLIRAHMPWMLGVGGSWLASEGVALVRFRQIPSYHMWSAKVAWFVTACTIFLLLLTDVTFVLPWTLGWVILSNLHAVAITLTLPRWEADVWSLRKAWRMRRARREDSAHP